MSAIIIKLAALGTNFWGLKEQSTLRKRLIISWTPLEEQKTFELYIKMHYSIFYSIIRVNKITFDSNWKKDILDCSCIANKFPFELLH